MHFIVVVTSYTDRRTGATLGAPIINTYIICKHCSAQTDVHGLDGRRVSYAIAIITISGLITAVDRDNALSALWDTYPYHILLYRLHLGIPNVYISTLDIYSCTGSF